MACHHPIPAYLDGKGNVCFTNRKESLGRFGLLQLRCGMCHGCKADHAREWAIRCFHESQTTREACFVTITYEDTYLPPHGSLDKKDLQLFFKRLRKRLAPRRIRYFACGEYGSKKGRPHYHACIFGWRPNTRDSELVAISKTGNRQYRHAALDAAWQSKGRVTWATFDSSCARYTAHYTADKLKGFKKDEPDPETGLRPYEIMDRDGVIWNLTPEFQVESRKPGLGIPWLEKNWRELFPADSVVMDGREYPVPRGYFKWLKENQPEMYNQVAEKRRDAIKDMPYESGVRHIQKTQAQLAKLKRLVRPTHEEK